MNNGEIHIIEATFYKKTPRKTVERARNFVISAAGYAEDSLRIKSYDETSGKAVFEVRSGNKLRHRQLLREVHEVATIEPAPGEKLTVYFAPGTKTEQVEQSREDVEMYEGCFSPDMVVLKNYDAETGKAVFEVRAGFSSNFRDHFIDEENVLSVEPDQPPKLNVRFKEGFTRSEVDVLSVWVTEFDIYPKNHLFISSYNEATGEAIFVASSKSVGRCIELLMSSELVLDITPQKN